MSSSSPHALTAHWKKFLALGVAALAVVWYFAFAGVAHHENRQALSVLVGSLFWVSILIGMLLLTMAIGLLTSRDVYKETPMAAIREA